MTPNTPLTLIKFGGAVITNKEIPESVREDVLTRLVSEIKAVWNQRKGSLILGNGAGSFAHVPASRYKTMDGFIHEESRIGMAITQDAAARLNRLVVHELIDQGIPAISLAPSALIMTKNRTLAKFSTDGIIHALENELLPVLYGDVVPDTAQGCTIWSTDTVFGAIARMLPAQGYPVERIIHVTEAGGVWSNQETKEIYPVITKAMQEEVRASMTDIKGFDVTGGMWHKICEALSLVDAGTETQIVSGLTKQSLTRALSGDRSVGTLIVASSDSNEQSR